LFFFFFEIMTNIISTAHLLINTDNIRLDCYLDLLLTEKLRDKTVKC
jgi:hypothetical protein